MSNRSLMFGAIGLFLADILRFTVFRNPYASENDIMAIYRVFAGPDGESHIEPYDLLADGQSGEFPNVVGLNIHKFSELRSMPFHPLPERRLILHLVGGVEIGVSDGGKQKFGPGDARLMEDTYGMGHTHQDLSPVIQAVAALGD